MLFAAVYHPFLSSFVSTTMKPTTEPVPTSVACRMASISFEYPILKMDGKAVHLLHRFSNETELYLAGFLVHSLWELWQIAIGMSRPFLMSGNNNFLDLFVDTALFMTGVWLFVFLQNGV